MGTPNKNDQSYNSPYAKPVIQYPSQSEDYLSLEIGGSNKNNQQQRYQQQGRTLPQYQSGTFYGVRRGMGGYSSTPIKYQTNDNETTNGVYFYQKNQNNYPQVPNRYFCDAGGGIIMGKGGYRHCVDILHSSLSKKKYYEYHQPQKHYGQQQQQQQTHDNNAVEGSEEAFFFKDTTGYQRGRPRHFNNRNRHVDISAYYHPSMLEDPWKELIERHDALNSSKIRMPEDKETDEDETTDDDNKDENEGDKDDNEADKDDNEADKDDNEADKDDNEETNVSLDVKMA